MSGTPGSPYAADALAANQAGQLTDQQRQQFRGQDRSFRKNELIGAAGAAIIGVLLITSSGPTSNAWIRPVGTVVAFVIAALLLVRATLFRDLLSSDLASGSVETVEGAVLRDIRQGQQTESFYLHVAGKTFSVPRSLYEAAPEAGYVRVYFLPRSKTVINLEHVPGPSVPIGVAVSPATLAREAIVSIGSGISTSEPRRWPRSPASRRRWSKPWPSPSTLQRRGRTAPSRWPRRSSAPGRPVRSGRPSPPVAA